MEKKLLNTAIAGVLAGAAAFSAHADTTLYGNVNLSINFMDVDGNGVTAGGKNDDVNMACNTCAIGVKGAEDLGMGGLKAIYQVEFQYDVTNRNGGGFSGSLTDRDQFVGLASSTWGKVRFGTISSSYKSHGAMVDPIYRTSAQGRNFGLQSNLHNGAGNNGEGRMTQHIRYDSPSWNGFKATVDYALDANNLTTSDKDTFGVGVQYKGYGALVFFDYLTSNQGGSDSAWKVGGKYNMDLDTFNIGIYGQYEKDDGLISTGGVAAGLAPIGAFGLGGAGQPDLPIGNTPNTTEGADVWFVGGTLGMGNGVVYLAYGQTQDDNNAAINTETATWMLVGDYKLSKLTDAYGGYVNVSFDQAGVEDTDVFTIGLRKKF